VLSDDQKARVALANALRPLVTHGDQQTAFVTILKELAQQEADEIESVLGLVGRQKVDGSAEVFTLNEGLAKRLEYARVRQQVYDESLVSYIVSLVDEAAEIAGRDDLKVEETSDPSSSS